MVCNLLQLVKLSSHRKWNQKLGLFWYGTKRCRLNDNTKLDQTIRNKLVYKQTKECAVKHISWSNKIKCSHTTKALTLAYYISVKIRHWSHRDRDIKFYLKQSLLSNNFFLLFLTTNCIWSCLKILKMGYDYIISTNKLIDAQCRSVTIYLI